jgi:hypothetical protein
MDAFELMAVSERFGNIDNQITFLWKAGGS